MKTIKSILILLPAVIFVLAFSTTKAQTAIEYLNQVPKFKD